MTSEEVLAFYSKNEEGNRLFHGVGRLERARTEELLKRFLPAPALVLDVGGGSSHDDSPNAATLPIWSIPSPSSSRKLGVSRTPTGRTR